MKPSKPLFLIALWSLQNLRTGPSKPAKPSYLCVKGSTASKPFRDTVPFGFLSLNTNLTRFFFLFWVLRTNPRRDRRFCFFCSQGPSLVPLRRPGIGPGSHLDCCGPARRGRHHRGVPTCQAGCRRLGLCPARPMARVGRPSGACPHQIED